LVHLEPQRHLEKDIKMANVRNLFATEITVDEDDLHSIIDERIRHFSANLLQPTVINKDDVRKIVADLLNKSHLRMVAIEAGETVQPRSHVPITRVVKKGIKLTKEQRKERIARDLASMPIAVQKNYKNLIPFYDRPMKVNPFYDIGVKSGKIKGGAEYVTDIKQYALDIGFAPEDLEPRLLTANYKKIMRGLWEPKTTLKSLKNSCGEYIKRFETVNGKDYRKPYPSEIFGIE